MNRLLRPVLLLLLFSTVTVLGYKTYRAFYPSDDFYVREFNENTGVELPSGVSILAKTATFPDIHGSYTACAVILLPQHDFLKIKDLVISRQDSKFAALAGNYLAESEQFFRSAGISLNFIESHWVLARKHQIKIGFLKDGKTIVFERHSS
ncbi:hypothetical protein HRG84_24375 [Flavisolibacter sp. BT320]|nr:hypothetical protein [Flavisolibacter longurius]